MISPSATSTIFNDKTEYPYFLRTVSDDTKQAKAIADLIKEYSWSHVMCLYSEGNYNQIFKLHVGLGFTPFKWYFCTQHDYNNKISIFL